MLKANGNDPKETDESNNDNIIVMPFSLYNMMKLKKCLELEHSNTSKPKTIHVDLEILLRLQRKNPSIVLKR
jgi:hypothetical protein